MKKNITVITEDGSKTIFVPSLDEHYHSTHGAIQESRHIFINHGLKTLDTSEINIFELGFGTGLNTYLTALEVRGSKAKISYTSTEKYPLPPGLVSELNYPEQLNQGSGQLFKSIHNCAWGSYHKINDNFRLRKIKADIRDYVHDEFYDLVYFDAFGPDKQPSMWTTDIIAGIASACKKDALFLTYSARGELKRQLRGQGFFVEHPPGPPGKREITRARKY